MRFLFYDRILSIEKGRTIVAVKSFPLSEEYLRGHFTRTPVIPPVVCVEAMAQVLGWAVIHSFDFKLSAILSLVEGVRVPDPAMRPGFEARIEGEVLSTSRRDSLGRARMVVGDRLVASVERVIFSHFAPVDSDSLKRRFLYYGGALAAHEMPPPEGPR